MKAQGGIEDCGKVEIDCDCGNVGIETVILTTSLSVAERKRKMVNLEEVQLLDDILSVSMILTELIKRNSGIAIDT